MENSLYKLNMNRNNSKIADLYIFLARGCSYNFWYLHVITVMCRV